MTSSIATLYSCLHMHQSYDSKKYFASLIKYYGKFEELVEQHSRCAAHDGPQRNGQDRNELDKGN